MAADSRKLAEAEKKLESKNRTIRKLKEQSEQATEVAVQTATTMTSSFAVSYFEARYKEKSEVMGMPTSLLVGVGATVAGALGVGGRQANLVRAMGDGALAAYAARRGSEMGEEAAAEA